MVTAVFVVNPDLMIQVNSVPVVAMKYWYPDNPTPQSSDEDQTILNVPMTDVPLAGLVSVGTGAVVSR
jgi:hypothetical protein